MLPSVVRNSRYSSVVLVCLIYFILSSYTVHFDDQDFPLIYMSSLMKRNDKFEYGFFVEFHRLFMTYSTI